MSELRPNKTRPEFDELSRGWGGDALPDLVARRDLLLELTQAEVRRVLGKDEIPDFALYRLGFAPRPADYPAP
jgi:hypothetical protein